MTGPKVAGEGGTVKVKADEEGAVLHITDQSVMFEKGGSVSGFGRSSIRMVKPDSDASEPIAGWNRNHIRASNGRKIRF